MDVKIMNLSDLLGDSENLDDLVRRIFKVDSVSAITTSCAGCGISITVMGNDRWGRALHDWSISGQGDLDKLEQVCKEFGAPMEIFELLATRLCPSCKPKEGN